MAYKVADSSDSLFTAFPVVDTVPTDDDFDEAVDGTVVVYDNESDERAIYVRVGGSWLGAALSATPFA